jgi:hypothetical protein
MARAFHHKYDLSIGLATAVIMAYSLFLHFIFWHIPLASLGKLMTPIQDENYSDQNYYLFSAEKICQHANWSFDALNVTWSSTGVVGYLTLGCHLFGTEFFYILFNPLLISVMLAATLTVAFKCGLKPKINLATILLAPYTLWVISLPGKEIISITGVLMVVMGLLYVSCMKRWFRGLTIALIGIFFVGFNRPHEAASVFIFAAIWFINLKSPRVAVSILFGGVILIAWGSTALFTMFGVTVPTGMLNDISLWSGSSAGKSYDFDVFFSALRSDNLIVHILLGFVRVCAVLLAPLSALITPLLDSELSYFIFRDLSQRLRLIDMILLFYCFYKGCKISRSRLLPQARSTFWMLPLFFLFMIYVVTFFGVSQKSRYIFQYVPLIMLWHWCWQPIEALKKLEGDR